MTSKVIRFPLERALRDNLPVPECFNQAKAMGLGKVIIMGFTGGEGEDGNFFFSASKDVTNETTLFLLKCAEKYLFGELDV